MKYLAIGFWYENQDFSLARETDSDDPIQVSDMLTQEAGMSTKDWLAVVLLVESVNSDMDIDGPVPRAPHVVKFWRGENGDFE